MIERKAEQRERSFSVHGADSLLVPDREAGAMKSQRRTVHETALALHLGLVDDEPARRARPPVASRVPPLRARIARQQASANLRADHVPQGRVAMSYLHGSTTVDTACSDPAAIGYWTKDQQG